MKLVTALDLFFGDERALDALRFGKFGGKEEQVAVAEQFFRAGVSMMVRESIWIATWSATRAVMFALMRPVMTSTDGRWVASRSGCRSRAPSARGARSSLPLRGRTSS